MRIKIDVDNASGHRTVFETRGAVNAVGRPDLARCWSHTHEVLFVPRPPLQFPVTARFLPFRAHCRTTAPFCTDYSAGRRRLSSHGPEFMARISLVRRGTALKKRGCWG